MSDSVVGDYVLAEDPTVNGKLERLTAEVLGKEAALCVPSGTMANQLDPCGFTCRRATKCCWRRRPTSTPRKPAAACGDQRREPAARSLAGTVSSLPMILPLRLRPSDLHHARSRLVCVENTHNFGGGTVWPLETLTCLTDAAHERGLAVHMDGARLWNAAAASGVPEAHFAAACDSVAVCFSKGLGAPHRVGPGRQRRLLSPTRDISAKCWAAAYSPGRHHCRRRAVCGLRLTRQRPGRGLPP